jgi:hypothetical protein
MPTLQGREAREEVVRMGVEKAEKKRGGELGRVLAAAGAAARRRSPAADGDAGADDADEPDEGEGHVDSLVHLGGRWDSAGARVGV